MIRLDKGPPPAVLASNAKVWTDDYLAAIASGDEVSDAVRYRYRHPEVKQALKAESYGKCVYCETKVAVGETDHISPVHARPELIADWLNLALTCKECNTHKGGYYAPMEPLINPFTDDPGPHLLIFGPLVMSRAGDVKGRRTVLRLKLGRRDLLERRAERVERLQALVTEYINQPAGATKDLLGETLRAEAGASSEYAAVVRAYIYHELGWRLPTPAPVDPVSNRAA